VVLKSGQELNRMIRLPLRTAESLTIDADPYVEPLETVLEEHPPTLVVKVSKNESRLYSEHLGHLEEIESLESFVPSDTVDASHPGKAQRHRLTHLRWHMEATAQLAGRLFGDRGFSLLILAGDESVVAEFERFLPDQLRARVVSRL
jgi:release factor family 10